MVPSNSWRRFPGDCMAAVLAAAAVLAGTGVRGRGRAGRETLRRRRSIGEDWRGGGVLPRTRGRLSRWRRSGEGAGVGISTRRRLGRRARAVTGVGSIS